MFGKTSKTSFINESNCYIGSQIPGKIIEKSFGLVSQITKGVDGNINDKIEEMMGSFIDQSNNLGGNAIINFRVESGSYQQNGSGWVVSYIILYGESVKTN